MGPAMTVFLKAKTLTVNPIVTIWRFNYEIDKKKIEQGKYFPCFTLKLYSYSPLVALISFRETSLIAF